MRVCPACKAENTDSAEYCTLCLAPLPDAAATPTHEHSPVSEPPPEPPASSEPLGQPAPPPVERTPPPQRRPVPLAQGPVSVGLAFRSVFASEGWMGKTLSAMLLNILRITSLAVTGYAIHYMGEVARGRTDLPEWGGWEGLKGYWIKGLWVTLVTGLLLIPAIVLFVVGLMMGATSPDDLGPGILLGTLLMLLYLVPYTVLMPAAVIHYAVEEDWFALRPDRAVKVIRAAPGYFKVWAVAALLNIVAGAIPNMGTGQDELGLLSCLSLLLFTMVMGYALFFLTRVIAAGLFGQWAARAYRLPQTPLPETPDELAAAGGSYDSLGAS